MSKQEYLHMLMPSVVGEQELQHMLLQVVVRQSE